MSRGKLIHVQIGEPLPGADFPLPLAKVYRVAALDEFRVELHAAGSNSGGRHRHIEGADYFATCKADAKATARAMLHAYQHGVQQ